MSRVRYWSQRQLQQHAPTHRAGPTGAVGGVPVIWCWDCGCWCTFTPATGEHQRATERVWLTDARDVRSGAWTAARLPTGANA